MDTDEKVDCLPDNLGKHKKPRLKKAYIAIGAFSVTFILFTMLVLPIFDDRRGWDILFGDTKQEEPVEPLGADDWLGISSAELDSYCGQEFFCTLASALDGTGYWDHNENEVHWFVLDLGQSYDISKVRSRSETADDPTDVNIYIDDSNPPTTLCEEGITTWQDTSNWVEITLTTPGTGRYIKVEIEDTEDFQNQIRYGDVTSPFTIFDAYGDVAEAPPTETWQNVNTTVNGAFQNTTNWATVNNTLSGSFINGTVWRNVNTTLNGIFKNITSWDVVNDTINGEFTNTSIRTWQNVNTTVNGAFINTTVWRNVDTSINGVFTNTTIWYNVDTSINGIFTNTTTWHDVDVAYNGEFTNVSIKTWQVVNNTVNGIFTNVSVSIWQVVNNTVNGVFTNTTTWRDANTSINGVFTNTTAWYNVDTTYNGAFTNTTIWHDVNTSVNGKFTNASIKAWQVVNNTVNGIFTNTTTWQNVNVSINGAFTNATLWYNVDVTYNGEFTNTTTWQVTDNIINGEFTNVSVAINIIITSEYPANGSTNIQINTSLHFSVNNSFGYLMNITVYTGSNLTNCSAYLGSFNSVNNGTYYLGYHNASNISTEYAWRVNVTDAYGNYAQETYNFTTASTTRDIYAIGGMRGYGMGMVMAFASSFLVVGIVLGTLLLKRRRKEIES